MYLLETDLLMDPITIHRRWQPSPFLQPSFLICTLGCTALCPTNISTQTSHRNSNLLLSHHVPFPQWPFSSYAPCNTSTLIWKPSTHLWPFPFFLCVWLLSHAWLCATPWTEAHQAPLSMGFFRQEYWSGLPFPPLGDLPDPGIEPAPLCLLHWRRTLYPLSHQESTTLIHRPKYLIILFFLTPACSHPTLEEYDFHRISATTS